VVNGLAQGIRVAFTGFLITFEPLKTPVRMLPDNILFSTDPASDLKSFLEQRKYSKVGVLVDDNTRLHCYPVVREMLPNHFLIEVRSGEEHKNLDTCIEIWDALTEQNMDRYSCLLVLGGGVLGDMGGFCAATFKRGIDFVLIPTTLLAQVDASIGGKLGVDFHHLKNHIGVFQQPALTLLNSGFLKSLPENELRSGFAEVIKHTLIADREMWEVVRKKSLKDQHWDVLIGHSVSLKAGITEKDPREHGLRKILNAGHTIGHAVETYLMSAGRRILHGEAIAVGLIAEAFIARQKDLLTESEFSTLYQFILEIFGKANLVKDDLPDIGELMLQDKKNRGNRILCVLLGGIGSPRWDCEISLGEVNEALSFYLTLHK
jgi:3-dehydroquinate synthase